MERLEKITQAYWEVGTALRNPTGKSITTEESFKLLLESDHCRPEEWKLTAEMHILRYDIIEGNSEWRGQKKVVNSTLIQFTRK